MTNTNSRKIKIIATVLFLLSIIPSVFSQEEVLHSNSTPPLNLRFDIKTGGAGIFFGNINNEDIDLSLFSNSSTNLSLGFKLSYYGFSLGLTIDGSRKNEDKVKDIFFGWFGNRTGIEMYYQNLKNFYIEGSYDIPNEYKDCTLINSGLSVYYFFRENNFRGLSTQSQNKLKNGWSPFIKPTMSVFSLKNTTSIIRINDRLEFNSDVRNSNFFESYQVALPIGLTGTLTLFNFYFSPIFCAEGVGQITRHSEPNGATHVDNGISFGFDLQLVTGYTGKVIFWGIWYLSENQFSEVKDLRIQITNMQTSLFFGFKI